MPAFDKSKRAIYRCLGGLPSIRPVESDLSVRRYGCEVFERRSNPPSFVPADDVLRHTKYVTEFCLANGVVSQSSNQACFAAPINASPFRDSEDQLRSRWGMV